MAYLMAGLQLAGTATTAVGQRKEGKAAKFEGEMAAHTLEQNAQQEQAYATRRSIEERREARLVASRAKAIAGKDGASTDDPTVQKILTDIEAEGEMRALLDMYEGGEKARGMRSQAAAARRGGSDAMRAANIRASGTILEGASSLYSKYGGSKKSGAAGGYG